MTASHPPIASLMFSIAFWRVPRNRHAPDSRRGLYATLVLDPLSLPILPCSRCPVRRTAAAIRLVKDVVFEAADEQGSLGKIEASRRDYKRIAEHPLASHVRMVLGAVSAYLPAEPVLVGQTWSFRQRNYRPSVTVIPAEDARKDAIMLTTGIGRLERIERRNGRRTARITLSGTEESISQSPGPLRFGGEIELDVDRQRGVSFRSVAAGSVNPHSEGPSAPGWLPRPTFALR